VTSPPPKAPPSAGFDVRIDTRLPPDGVPRLELDPGKRHEILVHMPGGEPPGATVPEAFEATAGMAMAKTGEPFAAHAPTGSGGVAIAIPVPAARGLSPSLAIAYTTAGGNGPFGWGWRGPESFVCRATTKAIVREHGRGVPEYDDAAESDVFVLSGAGDLVKTGEGIDASTGAVVITYRARVEGGFARIERHELGGRSHFVVRSTANVVSLFGQQDEACVADPNDPTRVFRWLLQEQRDDRGNVIVYRYKAEDLINVDTAAGSERSRTGTQPQRYLRRILYGNRDVADAAPIVLAALDDPGARARFMFEVVLDHGEHNAGDAAGVDDDLGWPVRADPFSSARAGFEVRTRRLCRRVLVFHRFEQLDAGAAPVLVRALELGYREDPFASLLVSARLVGYGAEGSITLPPRTFMYSDRKVGATARTIDAANNGALDLSLPRIDAELFDLHGDGFAGLLTREHGRFVFRPAGDEPGTFGDPAPIAFGATSSTDPAVHVQRWIDVAGTGLPALVELGPSDATVFDRDPHGAWMAGRQIAASKTPPVGKDPRAEQHRIYLGDLDGDGICDVLVAKADTYTWWRRMGDGADDGWAPQPPIAHDGDENTGPGAVLFDAARDLAPEGTRRTEAVLLADMTGDGLLDVVRVRADEIAYWPGLGYGRFGCKVIVSDAGAAVDETQVRACDVDGLGPNDLLILEGGGGGTLWLNACGNRLAPGPRVSTPPLGELGLASLARVDGRRAASFIWAPRVADATVTIVDLADDLPLMLVRDDSGTGLRTTIRHGTSTAHARAARRSGTPWRTRMPLAVPVVDAVVVEDLVRGTRFASSYRYAHGHYDAREREVCGFAEVEQRDEDTLPGAGPRASAHQSDEPAHTLPAVRTRSWFANGAALDLQDEYDTSDPDAATLPPPVCDDDETRRALRGVVLRTETFCDAPGPGDDADAASRPLVVTSHGWSARVLHTKGSGHHGCVLPLAEQTLTYTYERQRVPDPRLVQTAVLAVDDLGFATRTVSVAYPRRAAVPEPSVVPPVTPTDPAPPGGVLVRVVGIGFDTDKSFVLPDALPGLAVLSAQLAAHPSGATLVVGHTDRTGAADDNLGISLQRARRVTELLRHDVDGWLQLFDASMPAAIRWGAHEQALMLGALGFGGDVIGWQHAQGLASSGVIDAATLRALVLEYMRRVGAAIPEGLTMHALGAGEAYMSEATADGVGAPSNRRVEVFHFATAIEPAPPEKFLLPDAPEYAEWISRATARADVDAQSGAVEASSGTVAPLPGEARPVAAISTAPTDDPQLRTAVVVSEVDLVHQQEPDVHRLGTAVETRTFEVPGTPADPRAPLTLAALRSAASASSRRLVGRTRQYFCDDALTKQADLGVVGKRALPAKSLAMVFTQAHATSVLAPLMATSRGDEPNKVLQAGGYLLVDGAWWLPSSRAVFSPDEFYQPIATIDPFDNLT